MGLFAPEMVVYVAWRQYKSASLLTKSMNEVFEETHQARKHSWTMVHSFYAGMGGFVVETADPLNEPYSQNSPRLSLGSKGVLFVAQHGGYIPDMSKASIFDRSKADNMSKCLVCLQASWAIVQCISRLVGQLPLTQLEINTLGHVLCAFLMYMFWLQKPLDINEPTMITRNWTHPLCAWLLMSNSLGSGREWGVELSGLYVYPSGPRDMFPLACSSPERTPSDDTACRGGTKSDDITMKPEPNSAFVKAPELVHSSFENPDTLPTTLREHEILSGTMFGPRPNARPKGSDLVTRTRMPVRTTNLDRVTIIRWRLASDFLSEHWDILGIVPDEGLPKGPLVPNVVDFAALVMLEVSNWPGLDQLSEQTTSTCAKLCVAITLYGGLYVGAWNAYFPTYFESLLWRISAVLITSSGLAASVVAFVKYWKNQNKWKQTLRRYACRYLATTPQAECAMVIWFGECTFCAYCLAIVILVPTLILARLPIPRRRSVYQSAPTTYRGIPDTNMDTVDTTPLKT